MEASSTPVSGSTPSTRSNTPSTGSNASSPGSNKSKDKSLPYLNEMIHCHVCFGKASGLHYGVYSCEGCKGFFRRTQRLSLEYPVCPSYPCDITTKSRNKCQYCRYEKCVKLGMSTDAVRMGRVPNAEKDKMLQDMIEDAIQCSPDTEVTEEDLQHQEFVKRITACYTECYLQFTEKEILGFRQYCSSDFEFTIPIPIPTTIKQQGTPSFSAEQLEGPPKKLTRHTQLIRHLSCALEMGVHKTARFIKMIDELKVIEMTDRLTLFKHSCLEVAMSYMCNRRTVDGVMNFPEDNTFATDTPFDAFRLMNLIKRDITENKKKFLLKFHKLNLTDSEKALYMLLIIVAPDRENLKDPSKIEEIQEKASTALQKEVLKNHAADATKIFSTTLSLLTFLREIIPSHIKKFQVMHGNLNGKLPMEPTPLMKEILEIP